MTSQEDVRTSVDAGEVTEATTLLDAGRSSGTRFADRHRRLVIFVTFILLFCLELGAGLVMPGITVALEQKICDHVNTGLEAVDRDCKAPAVQGQIAVLRGWQTTLDCIPDLIANALAGLILLKSLWGLNLLALSLFALSVLLACFLPETLRPVRNGGSLHGIDDDADMNATQASPGRLPPHDSECVSLVALIIVLPALSQFLLTKSKVSSIRKDVWIARITGLAGLVSFALSGGMLGVLRSLLSSMVAPRHMGTLNSLTTVLEMVGLMVAGPSLFWSLRLGFEWGGIWNGLPFFCAAVMLCVSTAVVSFLPIREKQKPESPSHQEEVI
ncbi:putative Major facilitator superfamily domain-containing protein [Seiridium unicorne]|uniref:Major facilitator superfamily domain-containing protein n=1 Tax=Seiridium unicorne TaxID=138068 RepID=A0ABR2UJE1_9PEZI